MRIPSASRRNKAPKIVAAVFYDAEFRRKLEALTSSGRHAYEVGGGVPVSNLLSHATVEMKIFANEFFEMIKLNQGNLFIVLFAETCIREKFKNLSLEGGRSELHSEEAHG